jgi:benzoate-CoA ligase
VLATQPPVSDFRAADTLPARFNAAEWYLGRHVREGRGDRIALVCDAPPDEPQGGMTYADLDTAARRFANALLAGTPQMRALHPGDRVAVILPDGPQFAIAFWGTIAAGCVAIPLNPLLTPADHLGILADSGARVVITYAPDDAWRAATRAAGVDALSAADVLAIARSAEPVAEYAATHRDGFAFMLYSSGTTGEPKGVMHLHHDMWVCSQTYAEHVLQITADDRCFSVAKLFFAYGLGNGMYFSMGVGGSNVHYSGRPVPDSIFAQVAKYKPTLFFGVPTAYAQMLAAMDDGATPDFSSVRACVSAGEALPPGLYARWKEKTGLEILDGIGSTEILHIFLSNAAGDCAPGSSGRPVPGYAVRIVDEAGTDVPPGEIGDLLVRGDSTMAFYWNKHERTKATLVGDWIRTGDKYRCDENGRYWHAGRSDDMLKVGGIWVSPVELEGVIALHDHVLECAVVGRDDADGLTKPHAYVVLRVERDAAELEAELKAFVKSRLAPYKYPRWISVVEALPKTATGKTQRFVLRSLASA